MKKIEEGVLELAGVIAAVKTPRFSSALVQYISALCIFDCVVILGYSKTRKPVYLYDNITHQRELLFQSYFNGTYQHDPFYRAIMSGLEPGIYSFTALTEQMGLATEYVDEFYTDTGWKNEIGIVVQIDEERWVVVFLGFLSTQNELHHVAKEKLVPLFPVLSALCSQHWCTESFSFSLAPTGKVNIRDLIDQGIATFAINQLTVRERTILQLLLQGNDSKTIAEQLTIGVGTVKNHRKHIYNKLHIESQSALFAMFLNHLIHMG